MKLKIGLIAPNSNYLPGVSKDIIKAMEMALEENQVDFEIIVEPGGYNATKSIIEEKLQLLILKDVDLIISPLNAGLVEAINETPLTNQIPFIGIGLGEDIINTSDTNDYIFFNLFNEWQSMWLLGHYAAESLGKNISSLMALHDGGYGTSLGFAIGAEASEGKIMYAGVTHRESRTEDSSEEIKLALECKPDVIMGFYSGKEAASFWESRSVLAEQIPTVSNFFALEDDVLDQVQSKVQGVKTVSCWDKDGGHEANTRFKERFKEKTGKTAHCYGLLAFESAQLIAKAAKLLSGDRPIGVQLQKFLHDVQFDGPRGNICFDISTREVITRHYILEVQKDGAGNIIRQLINELKFPAIYHEQIVLARKNLQKQGWLNPYLIA